MSQPLHVLLIDNFDSFTFNLVDELRKAGAVVTVWRNDIDVGDALEFALALPTPRLIALSPGPGKPQNAGCTQALVSAAAGKIPIFGICLGMQAIVQAFGGIVGPAGEVVHGKCDEITHRGEGVFADLPSPLTIGRYHSLAAQKLSDDLEVIAECGSLVMAVAHRSLPVIGLQFHPESILTPRGPMLLSNVIRWAGGKASNDRA
jgi:anthranilate synthase component II